jgi:DNA-dependent RNA polymerase auxiliary subunit epsilon
MKFAFTFEAPGLAVSASAENLQNIIPFFQIVAKSISTKEVEDEVPFRTQVAALYLEYCDKVTPQVAREVFAEFGVEHFNDLREEHLSDFRARVQDLLQQ